MGTKLSMRYWLPVSHEPIGSWKRGTLSFNCWRFQVSPKSCRCAKSPQHKSGHGQLAVKGLTTCQFKQQTAREEERASSSENAKTMANPSILHDTSQFRACPCCAGAVWTAGAAVA
jgi:hypothetical protein